MCERELLSVLSDSLGPHGLYSSWNSPGQNTGVCSCSLFHEIFPTQGLKWGLLCCREILNSWATREAQVCKFFHSLLKFISTLKRESRPSTKNNLVTSLVVQWLRFHTSGGVIRSLVRELRSHMQCGVALISQNLLIENKTKQNKNDLCVQLSRNDWSASSMWKYVIHLFLKINIL